MARLYSRGYDGFFNMVMSIAMGDPNSDKRDVVKFFDFNAFAIAVCAIDQRNHDQTIEFEDV